MASHHLVLSLLCVGMTISHLEGLGSIDLIDDQMLWRSMGLQPNIIAILSVQPLAIVDW